MKKKKENYLKSIDDINYKLYIFERYLSNYPYDVTGIMLKDRYACMLKKVILEYERLFRDEQIFTIGKVKATMKEFLIHNTDKEEKGDITLKLKEILSDCLCVDGEKTIRFEKGEYHFYMDFSTERTLYCSNTDSHRFPEKYIAINLENQKNLTIDGEGSIFVMHGKIVPISAVGCENITFKNFSWDFPCAGTLEMKVVGEGTFHTDFQFPKKAQWEIKGRKLLWFEKSDFSGEKYWCNVSQNESYCVVLNDKENKNISRYEMQYEPFFLCRKIKKLNENTIRIHYFRKTPPIYKMGNIFELCTSMKRDCVGSFFCQSKDITMENISVHYMHGFGILTQMCENVKFISCNFTPSEDSDKHNTSFADLIHVSGAKGKIHIENCNFSNAHDDPINIHGTFTRVKKATDTRTLLLEFVHNQQNGFKAFHKGDKVVFYSRETFEGFDNEREFTVEDIIEPLQNGNSVKEMLVTFSEEIPLQLTGNGEFVAENITYTPEVYIGSCHFEMIPTRGILCTTRKKVVIENNVFNGMTMASIFLSNDCNDWYESGAIHDMTIRNNEFFVRKAPHFKGTKSAIYIKPIVANESKCHTMVHRNITIENNKFHLEHDNAVNAVFCENLVIRNNEIDILTTQTSDKSVKAFNIDKCKGTVIEDNIFGEGVS